MKQHIMIISILDIIFGVLLALVGQWFFMNFAFLAVRLANFKLTANAGNLIAVGALLAAIIIALGGFQVLVGLKLREYKSWARVAQIIIAVLSLPFIFLGTIFGIYCLWSLFTTEGQALFKAA